MSTRATYQFQAHGRNTPCAHPAVTFYIHHDGYPSGAAVYLWNAHHFEDKSAYSSLAARFVRANERAEFTDGHASHGDTEYRYTVRNGELTADARNMRSESHDAWRTFFTGTVAEFINAHPDMIDGYTPLRTVLVGKYSASALVLSRGQLVARVDESRAKLASYRERFPESIGNIGAMESDAQDWADALANYDAQGEATTKHAAQG